ncbi:CsgG/HfaB family protein [Sphingosinicella rhizophila]|uniref:CsgG/HfaB family protein n=1 Tax=Sphingosinicella rhizophila TaxID=3050082 RepID=A0ABU3Q5Y1_9SPHN|nr:CsgG/HfaB family protein [Sphingosinicella sp. GR2756]MDT9598816.1 CsgG/HfaB family protein [Sphingosinicella sp. GR2756]
MLPQTVYAQPAASAAPIPVVPGPKRTVAVGEIEANGGFEASENWNVGAGVSAMLTTALANTDRFVMVERGTLTGILNEQQLQASKVAGGTPSRERMTPAHYIIVGSVTDFGSPRSGGGFSIGGSRKGMIGGLGTSRKTGKVGLDLRIVDSRTGKILKSFVVSSKVTQSGIALSGGYKGIALGGDQFSKTPLGEATRRALHDAVVQIATVLAATSWEGRVVEAEGSGVIINLGQEAGVVAGDRLHVERVAKVLTDPATGQILSEERYRVGTLTVTGVEARIARANFTSVDGSAAAARGDLVIPAGAPRSR